VLAGEPKPIAQWLPVRFHHSTAECGARVVLLEDVPLTPGRDGWVQLVLERPIAAASGDRFILRDTAAQRTIGGGRLVDLRAPKRKRRTQARRAALAAQSLDDPAEAVGALLSDPLAVLDLSAFARDRALAPAQVDAAAEHLRLVRFRALGSTFAMSSEGWAALVRGIEKKLTSFHATNPDLQGIPRERLRLAIETRMAAPAFLALLQRLAEGGGIALDGAWVRLATHRARLKVEHEELWTKFRPRLGGSDRFRPPRVRDLAQAMRIPETEARHVLKLASRLGWVDEVAPDHFFLRETVAEMVTIMREVAGQTADGQFTAAQIRDRLDNGRKVAIQIVEFFDRHGVTLRRGDLRRINARRLDLFDAPAGSGTRVEIPRVGREASPVGRPDLKSGKSCKPALGGFDSHSLPPTRPARS